MTNYRKRLALLKGNLPRAVVRKSLKNITVQMISFNHVGDKVLVAADSKELSKFGWKFGGGNLPGAYLTGYLLGLRAKEKTPKAILDLGLHVSSKGARVYAALKGMLDAGLQIPMDAEVLPDQARVSGKHIVAYAARLQKEKKEKNTAEMQFKGYVKEGLELGKIEQYFTETKEKIAKITKEAGEHG